MLAIRLKRIGRKGQAYYRIVVQDSRHSPKSGKVVAYIGSLDPHGKTCSLDKDVAKLFLSNGAQPSNRAAKLLKAEGVKLPKWVVIDKNKKGKLRNPEKLRKNRPDKPVAEKSDSKPEEEKPSNELDEAKPDKKAQSGLEAEEPTKRESVSNDKETAPEEKAKSADKKADNTSEKPVPAGKAKSTK